MLTEQKEITVKPLPVEGQPAGFSWVVGKPEIDAEYSAAEVSWRFCCLKVTVSGNCSLEGLDRIIGDDLPGFTVYQSEKDMRSSSRITGIMRSRSSRYCLCRTRPEA